MVVDMREPHAEHVALLSLQISHLGYLALSKARDTADMSPHCRHMLHNLVGHVEERAHTFPGGLQEVFDELGSSVYIAFASIKNHFPVIRLDDNMGVNVGHHGSQVTFSTDSEGDASRLFSVFHDVQ